MYCQQSLARGLPNSIPSCCTRNDFLYSGSTEQNRTTVSLRRSRTYRELEQRRRQGGRLGGGREADGDAVTAGGVRGAVQHRRRVVLVLRHVTGHVTQVRPPGSERSEANIISTTYCIFLFHFLHVKYGIQVSNMS